MTNQPKPPAPEKKVDKGKEKMVMNLISPDQLEECERRFDLLRTCGLRNRARDRVADSRTH